eukprot:683813-Rhodomonas_salina.5
MSGQPLMQAGKLRAGCVLRTSACRVRWDALATETNMAQRERSAILSCNVKYAGKDGQGRA